MNPCGRAVDWSRRPYSTLARFFDAPGAPVVQIQWYQTDLPPIPPDTTTVINNRDFDPEGYTELSVGELSTIDAPRDFNNRWSRPPLLMGEHICHAEWFPIGEPYPTDLPPTTYLEGWIPTCCVPDMGCEFEKCTKEPVNSQPASQHTQYPIKAVDADESTPALQFQVASALDIGGGNWPGMQIRYFPNGTGSAPSYVESDLTSVSGVPYSHTQQYAIDADNNFTKRLDASGQTWEQDSGGVNFTMKLRALGSEGQLTGTNLKIDPALLPSGIFYPGQETIVAAGSTQGTATPITQSSVVVSSSVITQGVILPAKTGAVVYVYPQTNADRWRVYPPVGERINNGAVNAPFTMAFPVGIANYAGVMFVRRDGEGVTFPGPFWEAHYLVDYLPGWVQGVTGIAGSAGVSVVNGGTSFVPTITVGVSAGLASLSGASSVGSLYYLSASNTWSPVTIGSGITFSAGTLSASGGGGSPGGSSGQVQYNNSGAFGGAAAVTYATSGTNLTVTSQNATDVALKISGTTSQTGNLLEFFDPNSPRTYTTFNQYGGISFYDYFGALRGYIGVNPSNASQFLFTIPITNILSGTTSADTQAICINSGPTQHFFGVGDPTLNLSVPSNTDFMVDSNTSGVFTGGGPDGTANHIFRATQDSQIGFVVRLSPTPTANALEVQDNGGGTLLSVYPNGGIRPAFLDDMDASPDCLYFSTNLGKLCYKDGGGTVWPLY